MARRETRMTRGRIAGAALVALLVHVVFIALHRAMQQQVPWIGGPNHLPSERSIPCLAVALQVTAIWTDRRYLDVTQHAEVQPTAAA